MHGPWLPEAEVRALCIVFLGPSCAAGSGILPLGFEQWPSHNDSAWISLFSLVQAQKDGIRVGFKEVNNFPPRDLCKMVQTWYGTSLSGI